MCATRLLPELKTTSLKLCHAVCSASLDQNPVSTFILHHVQMIFIDKAIVMM